MRHYKPAYHDAFLSLYQQKEYHELLTPHFVPFTEELQQWAAEPFEGNSSYPEQLQYKTSSGILVRSKSEAIIELLLHMYKLPYRYECPLTLGNVTLYPDFTIRHPDTGDFYYWEHFGIIDEPEYRKNAISKLNLYAIHGIYPSISLITTYETKDSPLCPEYVETLIQHHFT